MEGKEQDEEIRRESVMVLFFFINKKHLIYILYKDKVRYRYGNKIY